MTYYVPGTEETDQKKVIMSLQQTAGNTATNTTNIATNTANIATNTANIATNTATLAALTGSKITAALGANVNLNNVSNYFDGPSIAQGSTGTWFVSGSVLVADTSATAAFFVKLWDGTTVIASGGSFTRAANEFTTISLSGVITSPAGNLRISVSDVSTTNGLIYANRSGLSKDSVITAYRIA